MKGRDTFKSISNRFIIQTGVLIEHPLATQIVNLDLGF
jgi:hypothetical protein